MDVVYTITAAVGCTALLVQVGLQLLGLGGDGDAHLDADVEGHEGDGNLFFGILSFKTLSAFAAFFGLAGLAAAQGGIESDALRLVLAIGAGIAAGGVVMVLMRGLSKLQASGTVNLDDVVGKTASVYLSIPAASKGDGKIMVEVQGRERELTAITAGPEIPTGATVKVTKRMAGDRFEVVRA